MVKFNFMYSKLPHIMFVVIWRHIFKEPKDFVKDLVNMSLANMPEKSVPQVFLLPTRKPVGDRLHA